MFFPLKGLVFYNFSVEISFTGDYHILESRFVNLEPIPYSPLLLFHPSRVGCILPGFVSFSASVLLSLDIRGEDGLSLPF